MGSKTAPTLIPTVNIRENFKKWKGKKSTETKFYLVGSKTAPTLIPTVNIRENFKKWKGKKSTETKFYLVGSKTAPTYQLLTAEKEKDGCEAPDELQKTFKEKQLKEI